MRLTTTEVASYDRPRASASWLSPVLRPQAVGVAREHGCSGLRCALCRLKASHSVCAYRLKWLRGPALARRS